MEVTVKQYEIFWINLNKNDIAKLKSIINEMLVE